MVQFRMSCYWLTAALILVLGGCAPSTATKPSTPSPSASTGSQGAGGQRQGEGTRGGTGESTTSPGSLDQLRQGQSSATSASSPLKDIFYDFDRYDLKADARDTLKANADWLKNNPSARIEIEGHCDDRGTNEYNLALGAKRAQTAKDYLVTLGIPAERLSTISYGEEIPVCKEQEESCWQKNRRARFVVVPSRPAS
ncbi:MAG TPA: peptidoglycan-associated lipoprotein Pal [Candidatus Udaeobacter sp.]|nr:peptidoglycan-associated lipoprotein Pal [Candidatus Udaeobacter sp.]